MKPILIIPVLALTATSTHAASVVSVLANTSSDSWNTPATWDHVAAGEPSSGAVSGNDYTATHLIRTPVSNSITFPGDSLTLGTGGALAIKIASVSPANIAIADLRLSGGSIFHFGVTTTANFSGMLTATTATTSSIGIDLNLGRNIAFDSLVTGNGTLRISGSNIANVISFNNASNTYSGLFDVRQGIIDFNYNHSTTASLTLSSQGKLLLDQNLAFTAVTINGDSLAIGSYTQDELVTANAAYAAFFSGSSTGNTITVIPEPSALMLGAIGALALLRKRR